MKTFFLTFDSQKIITSVDENFKKFCGFSADDLLGQPIDFLFVGESPKLEKKSFSTQSFFCKHKTDHPIYAQIIFSSQLVGNDKQERICLIQENTEFHELKNIINLSPVIVFLWSNETEWPVEFVSENIRHFGYEPDDFYLGRKTFTELIHDKDIDRVASEVERYSKEPQCSNFKQCYRIIDKSGQVRWIDDYTIIRRGTEGEITHYQGIILDVTERVRAEEKLEIAERYQMLFENTTDILLVYEEDGHILHCNNTACDILKYSRDELTQKTISCIELDDENILNNNSIAFFKDLEGSCVATTLRDKTGKQIPVQASFHVIEYKGIKAVLSIARHILPQKWAEEEIKRLAIAVKQLPDMVAITDCKGKVDYVNPAFEKITGFSRKEFEHKNIQKLIIGSADGELDRNFFKSIWKNLNDGESWSGQVVSKTKKGKPYNLDVILAPVFNEQNSIINFIFIGRDVSQKLLMEKQLRQAKKLESLGTLASGIAHDLNNILMVIKAFTELALDNLPVNSQAHTDMEEVLKAGDKCKRLIKQIISFSKGQEGKRVPIKVHQVVIEAMSLVKSGLPSCIKLKQQLNNCGFILGDNSAIKQIVLHMCTNAYQAIKDKGNISVSLSKVEVHKDHPQFSTVKFGTYVKLTIEDDGCGMESETKERMYDPFFTTKKLGENGGMGLSTVLGLVDYLEGYIFCDTEPEQGTTFNILFPRFEI